MAVQVVLIETNRYLQSFQTVDLFFHNHGFANVGSVLNNGTYLDSIYVRMDEGQLVVPTPWDSWREKCDKADRVQNRWCQTHTPWPSNRTASVWTQPCDE